MSEQNFSLLIITLIILIIISGYFSSSETAMMSLNRYKLKNLANKNNKSAIQTLKLLSRPDQLISLILLGNNFVNILAAQITTILTITYFGEKSLVVSTLVLTAIILIFAEVVPKTVAVVMPEKIALPSSWVLRTIMYPLYPAIWTLNKISNGIIKLAGISNLERQSDTLTTSELRTVVADADSRLSTKHRNMLLGILELERVTVEDIMIPKAEVQGIDLNSDWQAILTALHSFEHSRAPCYSGTLDKLEGTLPMRSIRKYLLKEKEFDLQRLKSLIQDSYFVPMTNDLFKQLLNFQAEKERIAFAVNEYGEIEGLITFDDLLEEILGEFSVDQSDGNKDVIPQKDGSFLIDGSANLRDINRTFKLNLPTDGPKTVNGLIIETMEDIPDVGTTFKIDDLKIEVIETMEKTVKIARLSKVTKKEDESSIKDF